MMRRRGGTNRLRGPKKDKTQVQAPVRKKAVADISGDLRVGDGDDNFDGATGESTNDIEVDESNTGSPEVEPMPHASSAADPFSDFVFKRPKTPPPRISKKIPFSAGQPVLLESRRIRSKLKPGKTGFPIGASLHGLSRSEKQERRSREKYRSQSTETDMPHRHHHHHHHHSRPAILDQLTARRLSQQRSGEVSNESETENGHYSQNESWRLAPGEKVVAFPYQTVTKLKFPPPRQRSVSEKRNKRNEEASGQHNVKESLEICQGFSKIKIEDWYPLFDFYHTKRNAPDGIASSAGTGNSAGEVTDTDEVDDDDEWEESLLYVDLEDIPDVGNLFSSAPGRRRMESSTTDNDDSGSLSKVDMKIFNLDSDLPVLLLGGRYLAGHWEDSCGTSLFFKKKSDEEEEEDSSGKPKLTNIVQEPEIPYDPVFGKNFSSDQNGYELVAKSMKVLKARYLPVVNEELKGEDVIRDADDEFDLRDFQIPPVSMVREFLPPEMTYDELLEKDLERRKQIREKWGRKEKESEDATSIVKTEPIDRNDDDEELVSDTEELDNIMILSSENIEPTPGPSQSSNK